MLLIGRYRIVEEVGRGSFACVARAVDERAGVGQVANQVANQVAIKAIRAGADPGTAQMLWTEVSQLGRVRHPALPAVLDVGRTDQDWAAVPLGSPFFAAEWIAGDRLDALGRLAGEALLDAVIGVLRDGGGALAALHAAGLLHRDVAPGNLAWDGAAGRAHLMDLGLAGGAGGLDGEVRGTLEYLAPEALIGMAEPRSDLYGLGAAVIALATGASPFGAAARRSPAQLVQAILRDGVPPPLPMLPPPLARQLHRLIARDPQDRPPTAAALLDELEYVVAALPGQRPAPKRQRQALPRPPLPGLGRRALVEEVASWLPRPGLFVLVGGPAAGGAAVAEAAVAKATMRVVGDGQATVERRSGKIDEVDSDLRARPRGAASTAARPSEEAAIATVLGAAFLPPGETAVGAAHAVRSAARGSAILCLDAIGDERAVSLGRALCRPGLAASVLLLVDEAAATALGLADDEQRRPGDEGPRLRRLLPLDEQQLTELGAAVLGAPPDDETVREVARVSAGEPLLAVELFHGAATAAAGAADAPGGTSREVATAGTFSGSLAEAWAVRMRAAPPAVAQLVVATAIWEDTAPLSLVLRTANRTVEESTAPGGIPSRAASSLAAALAPSLAEVATGQALGMLRRHRDELAIHPGLGAAALAALDEAPRADWARRALAAARGHDVSERRLAAQLLRLPLAEVGAANLLATAQRLFAAGALERAAALVARLAAATSDDVSPDLRAGAELLIGQLALARGDSAGALEAVRGQRAAEARLLTARAWQRRGELSAARTELTALLAEHPEHEEAAATLARVQLTGGALDDAAALAAAHPAAGRGGAIDEVLGLCAFYRGALDEADRALAAVEATATRDARPVALGRALSMRGMVAQQRGRLTLASERYAQAAQLLAGAGEAHAAATADLNLGTALAERGRHGDALAYTSAAGRVFSALGAADGAAAEVNRANSMVAIGESGSARAVLDAVLAPAAAASPHLRAFGQLVLAELDRRQGDRPAAIALCTQVLDEAEARGDAHARISAHIGLAEAGAGLPQDAIDELATSDDDRQRVALACARRTLLLGGPAATLRAASAAAAAVAQRAEVGDRQERAFRGFSIAAQLAAAAGEPTSTALARRAANLHAALVAAAPPAAAEAMRADPDLLALPAALAAAASSPTPAHDGDRDASGLPAATLRRLLSLSRRLNSEVSFDRLLDEVIDTAIELTSAERGFLLLRQPDDQLVPVVARNFASLGGAAGAASPASAEQISRSIAERAATSGEPVLTIDAGLDDRFDTSASVAALRLRSVLAVPLALRGKAMGCIYVDHRLRRAAFDDRAAAVLGELADIAAIAIGNAQMTGELRRHGDEIERLNRALGAELAERDAELLRVRAARAGRGGGDRKELRHRYEHNAGASPPVVQMLGLVDRAAGTSFPVVIVGESGSGKELVARALHDNGGRKHGPFVAVNCSALPDTLLESELFGHVRGAFTGADRERRGMFEVAHQGTLFLDEIADTSPAMQARLLRVLQDGVVRRIGDSATTTVDVRVVAATQRPLAELVSAGSFREDLRYRLEVLAIAVPPLRDRLADLPILIDHLLREAAGGRPPAKLSRAAHRALAAHRWPGNVRELANVLAHGLAMTSGDVLELGDLPASLTADTARPQPALPEDGDLRLRPALRATERAYLAAAMARANGNQTKAAKLLGLSRFGLQKKLRRDDEGADDEHED